MASPMVPSLLTLSDLEMSKSRSLGFQSLISRKRAELGPMLLLTTRQSVAVQRDGASRLAPKIPIITLRECIF